MKNTGEFLEGIKGVETIQRGKTFVETDDRGRTGVPGLYAAGRLAFQPYQTIIVAGHGASVGIAVLTVTDVPFYHEWVALRGTSLDATARYRRAVRKSTQRNASAENASPLTSYAGTSPSHIQTSRSSIRACTRSSGDSRSIPIDSPHTTSGM